MPLLNIPYTKTAVVSPNNATNVTYSWNVDGTIISGQNGQVVQYIFDTLGTKNVSVTVQNSCSTQTNSQTFTVCEPISGGSIAGPTTVAAGAIINYGYEPGIGTPATYNWVVDPNLGTILYSSTSNSIEVSINNTGSGFILLYITDCDNNTYEIQSLVIIDDTCIPITSVSF